jgi:hypothetical protein
MNKVDEGSSKDPTRFTSLLVPIRQVASKKLGKLRSPHDEEMTARLKRKIPSSLEEKSRFYSSILEIPRNQ